MRCAIETLTWYLKSHIPHLSLSLGWAGGADINQAAFYKKLEQGPDLA